MYETLIVPQVPLIVTFNFLNIPVGLHCHPHGTGEETKAHTFSDWCVASWLQTYQVQVSASAWLILKLA